MRIGAVRVDGDDRRMMGDQPVRGELVEQEALDVALARRTPRRGSARAISANAASTSARTTRAARVVAGVLLGAPHRLEALHEIGGGAHVDPGGAHQLDGAGIDQRDVRHLGARRVLHGDAAQAARALQPGRPAAPARCGRRASSPGKPCRAPDSTAETSPRGSPRAGTQVEPAPRRHPLAQAENAPADRIAAAEVVEQPAVDRLVGQGRWRALVRTCIEVTLPDGT